MSWQDYVDKQLLASRCVSKAAIAGHDGNVWAKSEGFEVSTVYTYIYISLITLSLSFSTVVPSPLPRELLLFFSLMRHKPTGAFRRVSNPFRSCETRREKSQRPGGRTAQKQRLATVLYIAIYTYRVYRGEAAAGSKRERERERGATLTSLAGRTFESAPATEPAMPSSAWLLFSLAATTTRAQNYFYIYVYIRRRRALSAT